MRQMPHRPPMTTKTNQSQPRPRLSRVFSNPNPNPISVGLVSQYRTLHHAQLDGAADDDVEEEAEDDDLIDPLDASHSPTRTTRRRGVTEAGTQRPMREGKGLPTWAFGNVRDEEEEDAREAADVERQVYGHEQAWIAHPALLPIMPRMDGRRWSFDL
jgi:hypothetical protein